MSGPLLQVLNSLLLYPLTVECVYKWIHLLSGEPQNGALDVANLRKGFVQLLYVELYCLLLKGYGHAATVGLNDWGPCKAFARAHMWWRRRELARAFEFKWLHGERNYYCLLFVEPVQPCVPR